MFSKRDLLKHIAGLGIASQTVSVKDVAAAVMKEQSAGSALGGVLQGAGCDSPSISYNHGLMDLIWKHRNRLDESRSQVNYQKRFANMRSWSQSYKEHCTYEELRDYQELCRRAENLPLEAVKRILGLIEEQ